MYIEIFSRGVCRVESGYGVKFGLLVGGEISSVDGISVRKFIKVLVYVRFGGSVGWDFGRGVGAGVDKYIGGEVESFDCGGAELEVWGEVDSENDRSFSKDVKD